MQRRVLVCAIVLLAGLALQGCSVVGAVAGGFLGACIGGPEGAAALGEVGFYLGAGVDIAVIGSMAEGGHAHEPSPPPPPQPRTVYYWYPVPPPEEAPQEPTEP